MHKDTQYNILCKKGKFLTNLIGFLKKLLQNQNRSVAKYDSIVLWAQR